MARLVRIIVNFSYSIACIMLSGSVSAYEFQSQCKELPKYEVDVDSYEDHIFKVLVNDNSSENVPLGTAFLLDGRGYFLSAAHVILDETYVDEQIRQGKSTDKRIEVAFTLDDDAVHIPAVVVDHQHYPKNELDIALLKGTLDEAYTKKNSSQVLKSDMNQLLKPIRLRFYPAKRGEEGTAPGYIMYKKEDKDFVAYWSSKFRLSGNEGNRERYLGHVLHGQSGSPMVDKAGYVFAVVGEFEVPEEMKHRYDQITEDTRRWLFHGTHLHKNEVLSILDKIPPTKKVEDLLERIKGKDALSSLDRKLIDGKNLELLEWDKLTRQIMKDYQNYASVLKSESKLRRYIDKQARRNCIDQPHLGWTVFLAKHNINPDERDLKKFKESYKASIAVPHSKEKLKYYHQDLMILYTQLEKDLPADNTDLDDGERKYAGRVLGELADLKLDESIWFGSVPTVAALATAKRALEYNPTDQVALMVKEKGIAIKYGTTNVQEGDSLSKIAERLYGDRDRWATIYQANTDRLGDNPNTIYPGMRLEIPANGRPYGSAGGARLERNDLYSPSRIGIMPPDSVFTGE